ncbi:hypothetical protein DSECCO2_362680 [anaerobic digester metagenome]
MLYSIRSYNRLNASETGILDIRVSDNRNRPISKAFVSIAKISYTGQYNESAEGIVIAELYTDNNGIVHIELPVLNELIGSNEFILRAFLTKDIITLIFTIFKYGLIWPLHMR